jgi:hypothetical protein
MSWLCPSAALAFSTLPPGALTCVSSEGARKFGGAYRACCPERVCVCAGNRLGGLLTLRPFAAGGRAHALVINFEQEMVAKFGSEHSLADQLRFPLFVASITAPERKDTIKATRALQAAQTVLAAFDAGLDSEVLDDQRYDFRVRLIPMLGPKSAADAAIEFVKLDELNGEERKVMIEAGRSGRVVTKVRAYRSPPLGACSPRGSSARSRSAFRSSSTWACTRDCGSTSSFVHRGGQLPPGARLSPNTAYLTSRPDSTSTPLHGLTRLSRRLVRLRSLSRSSAFSPARAG